MPYRFRPSAAPIWGNCSGSAAVLNETLDVESVESREGTAAHWVGAELLRMVQWFGDRPPARTFIGRTCNENGVIIDDRMAEGAEIYAADVSDYIRDRQGELLIEHPVTAPQVHPDNGGTLDCAFIEQGHITLWDYKHGHGAVDVRSLQFANYVAGLINKYGIDGLQDQHTRLTIRLVQPFCYQNDGPVQVWTGYLSDLRADINQLHNAAGEADTNPTLRSGTHCRYCPALWRCSAVRQSLAKLSDHVERPPNMDDMDGDALAIEWSAVTELLRLGKARANALEDVLTERVKQGDASVPLTLTSKPGRLKWDADTSDVYALGTLLGVDLRKDEPVTPTQAIALAKGHDDIINQYASRPSKTALVDKSESLGARAFSNNPKGK